MNKITCIIPAYNEAERIKNVLEVITKNNFVSEIIVVDDASTDNTQDILSGFEKIKVISHEKNLGKSMALYTGIKESLYDTLLFIDSDLLGLKQEDVDNLVRPVVNNECDTTISLRKNAPKLWHVLGIDYISGERVLPKKLLLENIDKIQTLPRFGIESFFNKLIIENNLRIKVVKWPNVISPFKFNKIGLVKGFFADFLMIIDIFKTIGIIGPFYQIMKLKKLEVK